MVMVDASVGVGVGGYGWCVGLWLVYVAVASVIGMCGA